MESPGDYYSNFQDIAAVTPDNVNVADCSINSNNSTRRFTLNKVYMWIICISSLRFFDWSINFPIGNKLTNQDGTDASITNTLEYITFATAGNAADFGDQ